MLVVANAGRMEVGGCGCVLLLGLWLRRGGLQLMVRKEAGVVPPHTCPPPASFLIAGLNLPATYHRLQRLRPKKLRASGARKRVIAARVNAAKCR